MYQIIFGSALDMTFVRFGTAAALGLALAAYFLGEVAEPVRSAPWSGSTEQWLAVASLIIGGCATLVAAAGAWFAISKMLRPDH
jgi:hypothetical protein